MPTPAQMALKLWSAATQSANTCEGEEAQANDCRLPALLLLHVIPPFRKASPDPEVSPIYGVRGHSGPVMCGPDGQLFGAEGRRPRWACPPRKLFRRTSALSRSFGTLPLHANLVVVTAPSSPASVYAVTGINPDGTEHYEPIEGWKSIARSDTGAVLSLNKNTYTVIDHGEMGEIVEAVLAQPNVKWETAGVIDSGRAVWCLAFLDEPITLPGDDSLTLPYLAITNRHDGTAACALRATAVRIVCANTFRAAELEGERTGTTFSFIHKSAGATASTKPARL